MLEMILDRHIMYVLMGVFAAIGIVSKCISNAALKRLVRAAGNMNKSTHPLMRLVRAKFEHACMISEKVENVGVFVDKYLYEYKVAGMKLHSLRRMEKTSAGLCLIAGLAGAGMEYAVNGMQDAVIKTGAAGGILAVLVYLFHLTTDENYRFNAAKNYMVDYLENVCLHRYEKAYQKELKVMAQDTPAMEFSAVNDDNTDAPVSMSAGMEKEKEEKQNNAAEPLRPHPGMEVPSPVTPPEITPPAMPEPYEAPKAYEGPRAYEASKVYEEQETVPQFQPVSADIRQESRQESRKSRRQGNKRENRQERADKDVLIRQILEEFMA